MRIVVAGAAGFLGSHVVEEAVRHDTEVVALIPTADAAAWVAGLGATPQVCSPSDPATTPERLAQALHEADFLINAPLAGQDHVATTTALLDAALRAPPTLRGVVQLSSTRTYGHRLPNWPLDESWVARPDSRDMQNLAAAERAARTYRRLRLVVLRAAPSFGPRDDGVLQRLLQHFGAAGRPVLAGGGRAGLSLAYGPDFARAVWAVLEAFSDTQGRTLHCKSIDTDWRTLVGQARALRDRPGRVWPLPVWLVHCLAQAGEPGRRLLDGPPGVPQYAEITGRPHLIDDTLLRGLTGFAPLFGLRAALRHTMALESRESS